MEIDREFLPAHIALGFCEIDRIRFGVSNSVAQSLEIVLNHYQRAFALDPDEFWVNCLGAYLEFFGGQVDQGINRLRRLIEAEPYDPEKTTYLASLISHSGDVEQQFRYYSNIKNNGHETPNWVQRGFASSSVLIGDANAETAVRQALELDGPNESNLVSLILLSLKKGDAVKARKQAILLRQRSLDFNAKKWATRYSYGNRDICENLTRDLVQLGL